jgi:hypothetical protein
VSNKSQTRRQRLMNSAGFAHGITYYEIYYVYIHLHKHYNWALLLALLRDGSTAIYPRSCIRESGQQFGKNRNKNQRDFLGGVARQNVENLHGLGIKAFYLNYITIKPKSIVRFISMARKATSINGLVKWIRRVGQIPDLYCFVGSCTRFYHADTDGKDE